MADIDRLLNAIEWTSLYVPLKVPKGRAAKLDFAKQMAMGLVLPSETPPEFPPEESGSSPVDLLLEGQPGLL